MPRHAVAASAHGDRKVGFAGERNCCDYVVDVQRPSDDLRAPVVHAVERDAGGLVPEITRDDHRPAVLPPEIGERGLLQNRHLGS